VNDTARRPKITVSSAGKGVVSQAGALLLAEAAWVTGLGQGLSTGLARWRVSRAIHDPGKIIADLAVALALGGECLGRDRSAALAAGAGRPDGLGPMVSRLVTALAADVSRALRAIRKARAAARERVWALAGDRAPGADGR
jgi:hypothetical protein